MRKLYHTLENKSLYTIALLYLGIPTTILLVLHAGLYWMIVVYYFPLFRFGYVYSNSSELQLLLMGFTDIKTLLEGAILGSIFAVVAGKVLYTRLQKMIVLLMTILTILVLAFYVLEKLLVATSFDRSYWPIYWSQLKGEIFLLGVIFFPFSSLLIGIYKKRVNQKLRKSTA